MMHSSHHVMGGYCSCGMYHTPSNSFSMLFSMSSSNNGHGHRGSFDIEGDQMYSFANSNNSSSNVDCTLSLGTPSTRSNVEISEKKRSSCMSNFGWNILQSKRSPAAPPPSAAKSHRNGNSGSAGGDPLLARRCANCDTTSTPLWRNGPRGPKSLCNACGIRFKKEERRATAAAATHNGGAAVDMMNTTTTTTTTNWPVQPHQKMPCYTTYNIEQQQQQQDHQYHHDSDNNIPFLSWRFNVTDNRPSLVHDFTR